MMKEKLVLVGTRKSDGKKVIIKASNNTDGKKEIESEKNAYNLLKKVAFASDYILLPSIIDYRVLELSNYLIMVTEFIPQEKVFVSYTLEEQFFLILRAFEAQESFHATTFEHVQLVKNSFPIFSVEKYMNSFRELRKQIKKSNAYMSLGKTLHQSEKWLIEHKTLIEQYSNYLTHTDFVPHNFRVNNRKLYMLDLSAVHFGNKYEGWARFLNYMTIHNPELEKFLSEYILKNRGEKDYLNLRLMRVYKIGFLLKYYAESLEKTSGDLHALTAKRIGFWHEVLKSILDDKPLSKDILENYIKSRNTLRSEEEKKRQKEFAMV